MKFWLCTALAVVGFVTSMLLAPSLAGLLGLAVGAAAFAAMIHFRNAGLSVLLLLALPALAVAADPTPESVAGGIRDTLWQAVQPWLFKLALFVGTARLLLKPLVEYIRAVRSGQSARPTWRGALNWLTSINVNKLPLLCAGLLLAGCAPGVRVPANTVVVKTPRGELQLTHPHNTKVKDVDIHIWTNGFYSLSIGSLESHNNPEVIDRSAAGQVALIKAQSEAAQQLIRTGLEAGGHAAAGAVKP